MGDLPQGKHSRLPGAAADPRRVRRRPLRGRRRVAPPPTWVAEEARLLQMKYLLDTNAASEPLKLRPNEGVMARIERHWSEVAIASVTLDELLYGMTLLPRGRRKSLLQAEFELL